MRTKEQQVR